MGTVKFFTEDGYKKYQHNNFPIEIITSLDILVVSNNILQISFGGILRWFPEHVLLFIEGEEVVGSLETKMTEIRIFFKDDSVENPGGGGDFDSQSFTATSGQTQFTTTYDLPSDSKRVHVYVFANGIGVLVPFSKSGNTVTISARDLNDTVIVEKI
jgi:hypothetical protein